MAVTNIRNCLIISDKLDIIRHSLSDLLIDKLKGNILIAELNSAIALSISICYKPSKTTRLDFR